MTLQNSDNGSGLDSLSSKSTSAVPREVLEEELFKRMIAVERKRTERSAKPFLLMLLEAGEHQTGENNGSILGKVIAALSTATRETDVIGWHKNHSCVGVMFTQLVVLDQKSLLSAMLSRVGSIVRDSLNFEQFSQINISFHFFPDKWDHDVPQRPSNPALYPDLPRGDNLGKLFSITKRIMDISGSLLMLAVCLPLFLLIAITIKVTSKGSVFYRQQRVGQYGKLFTFLKFRSMYVNNDPSIHRDYVIQLIGGQAQCHPSNGSSHPIGIYKLTNDKRITRVGVFLRRTSLDELPQLLNVLQGEMSLVGPRPAIPYEVDAYQTWHRRRILEVKPGITGLWQVYGRGRVKFDEMVRLDLRYAREWSPWLDLKILLRTPRAVIHGAGAY